MKYDSVEEELMKEVASEMRLPYKVVYDIVIGGQNAFIRKEIRSGSLDSIRMPYLGTFKAKVKHATIQANMKRMDPITRYLLKKRIHEKGVFSKSYQKSQDIDDSIQT